MVAQLSAGMAGELRSAPLRHALAMHGTPGHAATIIPPQVAEALFSLPQSSLCNDSHHSVKSDRIKVARLQDWPGPRRKPMVSISALKETRPV